MTTIEAVSKVIGLLYAPLDLSLSRALFKDLG